MEMAKNEPHNPIMQDTKNNAPRYYTYGTPFFNYGFFPQTWEVEIIKLIFYGLIKFILYLGP
jgi:3'-phosphoadenosine 5'-phosphosulfate synthase